LRLFLFLRPFFFGLLFVSFCYPFSLFGVQFSFLLTEKFLDSFGTPLLFFWSGYFLVLGHFFFYFCSFIFFWRDPFPRFLEILPVLLQRNSRLLRTLFVFVNCWFPFDSSLEMVTRMVNCSFFVWPSALPVPPSWPLFLFSPVLLEGNPPFPAFT